jgi:hypothetical protein
VLSHAPRPAGAVERSLSVAQALVDPPPHLGDRLTAVSEIASLFRRDAFRDLRAQLVAM